MSTLAVRSGGRKTANVKAIIRDGSGKISANGMTLSEYFLNDTYIARAMYPWQEAAARDLLKPEAFDLELKLQGGGKSGQAGASRLAIARALKETCLAGKLPETILDFIREDSLLTRIAKKKERRKFGLAGKARKAKPFVAR